MIGSVKEKMDTAIALLRSQGHSVTPYISTDGKLLFDIDSKMQASSVEMQGLADGAYALAELEQRYKQRRVEEQRSLNTAAMTPHWVNVVEKFPQDNREVFLLTVGPDRNGTRDIEYAKGKRSSGDWIFTVPSRHTYVVAWLEDGGGALTFHDVSNVRKDDIRF